MKQILALVGFVVVVRLGIEHCRRCWYDRQDAERWRRRCGG